MASPWPPQTIVFPNFSDKKVKDQDLVAPQEFHSFTYNVRIIPVNFKL